MNDDRLKRAIMILATVVASVVIRRVVSGR